MGPPRLHNLSSHSQELVKGPCSDRLRASERLKRTPRPLAILTQNLDHNSTCSLRSPSTGGLTHTPYAMAGLPLSIAQQRKRARTLTRTRVFLVLLSFTAGGLGPACAKGAYYDLESVGSFLDFRTSDFARWRIVCRK